MTRSLALRWLAALTVLSVMVIAVFLWLEKPTTRLVLDAMAGAPGAPMLSALIVTALALDVLLPVPSSVVNVSAGAVLGFASGCLAAWLGMTLGCLLGYWIGATGGTRAFRALLGPKDLDRSAAVSQNLAFGALLAMRAVPVLAEVSTIAAGIAGLPFRRFVAVVALANLGIAAAYAGIGALALQTNSFLLAFAAAICLPLAGMAGHATYLRVRDRRAGTVDRRFDGASRPAARGASETVLRPAFAVDYCYRVDFTRGLFAPANRTLRDALHEDEGEPARCLVFVDANLRAARPGLDAEIATYFRCHAPGINLAAPPIPIAGGEAAKDGVDQVLPILRLLQRHGIDRHSFVIVIGGGAVLDSVGFAAAIAHRGIRHVRIPTTVLGQNDSGVGVKNAVNFGGAKNYAGTFAPPRAVLCDFDLLDTLPPAARRDGIAEAVKVALIRDRAFFAWLEAHAEALRRFEPAAEEHMIRRSAELHLNQITGGGDPFETGSARPLDFGHWSAHKLESLTGYELSHGGAVAIGIALDARYSVRAGMLAPGEDLRVLNLLRRLGLRTWHPALRQREKDGGLAILRGLEEFREHLGGILTITLLRDLGTGVEVHSMDPARVAQAIDWLAAREAG